MVLFQPDAADRHDHHLRRGRHAGQRGHPRGDLGVEIAPPLLRHAGAAHVEVGDQDAVLAEAGVERHQIAQAAHEQQRADHQHQRQRDLRRRPAPGAFRNARVCRWSRGCRPSSRRRARCQWRESPAPGRRSGRWPPPAPPRTRRCASRATTPRRSGCSSVVRKATRKPLSHWASSAPPAAPIAAISRLSASSCRTMRPREAPIASRTAISRSRAVARASIRLARLAQAISSTRPVVASSSHSGDSYVRRSVEMPVPAGKAPSLNLR